MANSKLMGKKILAIVIFLLAVSGVFFFLYRGSVKPAEAPNQEEESALPGSQNIQAPTSNQTPTPVPTEVKIDVNGKELKGTFSAGEDMPDGSSISVLQVDFDGKQFTPASIDIKVNDWIFFKNNSESELHLVSSVFPQAQTIAPTKQYKFQFTKAGKFTYENSLQSFMQGVVNVSQ